MAVIGGTGPFSTASGRQIPNPFATKPAGTNAYAGMSLADVQSTLGNIRNLGNISNQPYIQSMVAQLQARLKALQPTTTRTASAAPVAGTASNYLPGALYQPVPSSPDAQTAFASQGTPLGPFDPTLPLSAAPPGKRWMKLAGAASWTLEDDPVATAMSAAPKNPLTDSWVKEPGATTWSREEAGKTYSPLAEHQLISVDYASPTSPRVTYDPNLFVSTSTPSATQAAGYVPQPYTSRRASKPRATTSKGYGWYYS